MRGKVKVETKGKTESVGVKGKRDNRLTKGHQSGRLRRTPGCDDDPQFMRTSYARRKTSGSIKQVNKAAEMLKNLTMYEKAISRGDAMH